MNELSQQPAPAGPAVELAPATGLAALWRDIRMAIRGVEHDYTSGSIGRAILLLAIPMVLEMVMESVFVVVDVFFVARLGADAVAAVGLTDSVVTLVFAVAIGLSMATIAVVARRIGQKDRAGASMAAVQAILLGVLIAIPIGVLGAVYAGEILALMGASEAVISTGSGFTAVLLGGNVTIMLLFLINAIFRGAGDAAIAMRSLWFANICNIVLDPCLIFGIGPFPTMGVTGAAVATTIGRGLGVVYQLVALWRGSSRISIDRRHLRLDVPVMANLLRISIGGILQFLIATASWLGLVRILALFGSGALAGYTIALRVLIFVVLPSWGMSNAAATLVGQNLGAGQPARAERSVWRASLYNMLFLVVVAVGFIAFPHAIVGVFTDDPVVVPHAVDCLRIISYGFGFYALGMVMVQAFNGAGDTMTPTIINFFCYWLFQIPLAYVLAVPLGFEARGVYIAILLSESLLAVVGILVFRRGRWKRRQV